MAGRPTDLLDTYHLERHLAGERTLRHTQAQVALRRGLDPAADALRKLFEELLADEAPRRRIGEFIAGADVRYPASGTHPLAGTFVADLPGVAASLRAARRRCCSTWPIAPTSVTASSHWDHRVDVRTAVVDDRPADAAAAAPGRPRRLGRNGRRAHRHRRPGLRRALRQWFGEPRLSGSGRDPG